MVLKSELIYAFDWIVYTDSSDRYSGITTSYFLNTYEDCYRDMMKYMGEHGGEVWQIRRTHANRIFVPIPSDRAVILAQSKIAPHYNHQGWRDRARERHSSQ